MEGKEELHPTVGADGVGFRARQHVGGVFYGQFEASFLGKTSQ